MSSEPFSCLRLEDAELGPIEYPCPPPSKFNHHLSNPVEENACQIPCIVLQESIYADDQEIHRMFITSSVLHWISLVFVLITIAIYLSIPALRVMPHRITIYIGVSLFWIHLAFVGNSFLSLQDLMCDGTFAFSYGGWCKFSAISYQFGAMTSAGWWLIQGIYIFWSVTLLRDPLDLARFEPLFHVLIWGYSLTIVFIINFVPDREVSGGLPAGLPFCNGGEIGILWGLFLSIFILLVAINLIFIGSSLLRVVMTPVANASNKNSVLRERRFAQILIIVYMVVYLNVLVAFISVNAYYTGHQSQLKNGIADFYQCVFTTPTDPSVCSTSNIITPSQAWYIVIVSGTIGMFYGIVFLLMRSQVRKEVTNRFTTRAASISSSK